MREEIAIDNQSKNLNPKANGKQSGHPPKPKSSSSWGSQIVKGFVTAKKSKSQASIPNKKPPVASLEVSSQKNQYTAYQSRVKRSLIGEFPCLANSAQVHPHALDNHRLRSPSSHDLFIELDHLRSLLRDSKDIELALQSQLLQYKENLRVSELEKELDAKRTEIERLNCKVGSLQVEIDNLLEQLASLTSILEAREDCSRSEGTQNPRSDANGERRTASYRNLEMEVVELRRLNKELQLQKRSLAFRLSSTESQLAAPAKVTEIKADVETQGEFVKSLIKEVNDAAYQDIEDVVAFVKWLDDELCFLVDERAVLKHFDWPEKKADTLREAAFGYRDLQKLEAEITNFKDNPRLPCDVALKKIVALSEKMERSVYNLLQTRCDDATLQGVSSSNRLDA